MVTAIRRSSDHAKSDCGEVMIERIGEPDARPFHDHEAGRVDGRELVQVGAPEVVPGLLEIAQLAGKHLDGSGLIERLLPCERNVAAGIAIEKCECLDD